MNKWLELLLGVLLLVAPIIVAIQVPYVASSALAFLTGGITVGIALIGVMFVMLGLSDLRA